MILFKSKLKKYKLIRNRNKAFNNLSEEQQRKEIAFDALQMLLKRTINAESGVYWNDNLYEIRQQELDPKTFQKKLCSIKKQDECTCCARGALMLSTIRLGNEIDPRKDDNIASGDARIIKGFSFSDFLRMERQFEYNSHNELYETDQYDNQNLANILCNVIANGNYVAEDNTDYVKIWKLKIK